MRALRERPDHAGALAQGRARGHDPLHARGPQGRGLLPEARAQGRPRLRGDGADRVPLRPPRRRGLPDRDRGGGLVRADGHDHLPPVAGAQRRRRPPRRAAARPRPPAGHRLRGRPARWPPRRARCSDELGYRGFPKTSGGRGIHIYVRIEPKWTFTDVRHAAIAFGRELERRMPDQVTTKWWKEERGEKVFIDYNQNARDRTIASPYSIRAKPGAPVSAPLLWDEVPDVAPEDFTVATMPARFADVGDRFAEIDDVAHSLRAAAGDVRARRGGRHALPARLPEDAGRAQARAALAGHRPQEGVSVELEVLQADVTKLEVDAIANAANTSCCTAAAWPRRSPAPAGRRCSDESCDRGADRPRRGGRDHRRRHAGAVGDPRRHDGAGRADVGRDHRAATRVHARAGGASSAPVARAGGLRHGRGRLPAGARRRG